MEKLQRLINNYVPFNEQEENDKKFILHQIQTNDDLLSRENKAMHFTASNWIVNQEHTKVLMIYHKIYQSWSWCGGHADGNANLLEVAIQEMREETGVSNYKLVSDQPFSIEILTVDGHDKKGQYVSSHLHLNVTYLFEVDEEEALVLNEQETEGVQWIPLNEIENNVSEKWMLERIYKKLMYKVFSL